MATIMPDAPGRTGRRAAVTVLALMTTVSVAQAGEDADVAPEPMETQTSEPPLDGGDPWDEDERDEVPEVYDVSVFGDTQSVERVAGPAHKIRKEELERFEDDNVHRILPRVPGVYVRGEDGYGLRPNIGMRGASSDRSAKVNLLEDGVLLGPAPYSAPAAYYFPLMTRMTGIEVFKGPGAIRHGPNTIGGTINFMTRPIPNRHRLGLDLAAGTELYGKAHGYYGYGAENWGVIIEGVRLRSSGFKQLDSADTPLGGNTGFDKLELMGKARINTDPAASLYNEGSIKVTLSREVSNETYLGLTDADFADNPLRRYAASAQDQMRYQRIAVSLSHALVFQEGMHTVFTLRTTAYRRDFNRAWRKLDRIAGAQPIEDILANPSGRRAVFYDVLTGADSTATEPLLIGTNDRTYVSQGVQSSGAWRLPSLGPVAQRLQFGARIHNDSVDRLLTSDAYAMRSGVPQLTGTSTVAIQNTGRTVAFAGYAIDEITLGPVLFTPGVRMELIDTRFENALDGEIVDGIQRVLLPGAGALYQPLDAIAILGGVHMGFSPLTPGQTGDVRPEVAVNYEFGARVRTRWLSLEATRFISDYSNLSSQCTFSSGCTEADVDTQFGAGEARIAGVEAMARLEIPTPIDLEIPVTLTYTFTRTNFLTSFTSSNPQWGDVTAGDELPSVPRHQAAATLGLLSKKWGGLNFGLNYMDGMRETAGSGPPGPGERTDSFLVIDTSAQLNVLPELALYGKVENLLNNSYIVSRRPFGARPGRPRFIYGGVKILIDR